MSYILHSFYCECCDHEWEDLVDRKDLLSVCEKCQDAKEPCIAAAGIAAFSIKDRDSQMAELKKRSYDHSMREAKKGR